MLEVKLEKNKSLLKTLYKTHHGKFETIEHLAKFYNIDFKVAKAWIKQKKTSNGWQIRIITIPVDRRGNELTYDEIFGEVE